MQILDIVLKANKLFIQNPPSEYTCGFSDDSKVPTRKLAILTCMDTRLVDFLEPAMGITRGEAKIIKNAGNTLIGPFEDTIRSLIISIFELDVNEIMVIGHLDCGMSKTTSPELKAKMLARGISPYAIKMIEKDLDEWIDHFHHPEDNVKDVVMKIKTNPLIPDDIPVHGLIIDPCSGELQLLMNGYEIKE